MQHHDHSGLRGFMVAATFLLLVATASAQVPQTMSFQGQLGAGVSSNSSQSLTFRIYTSSSGGTSIWSESQTVTLSGRVFSVVLGSVTPLDVPFDREYWIGITVGSGTEMTPRIRLTSAPYSLNTEKIGGRAVADMVTTPTDGQVLKWNSSSTQWEPATNAISGAAGGDLGGTYPNPSVATVGGVSAANVASGVGAANAATATNTASTIVMRNASGNFAAGTITADLVGDVTGDISGNAATVTNGVYTSGSYSDPSFITSLAGSKITGDIDGNAQSINGSIAQSQVTDLADDLAEKASDDAVVHLSGNETIAGTKSFSSVIDGSVNGSASSITGNLTGDVTSVGMATTIAGGAVTTSKIADGAVTNAKITDVEYSKITGAPTSLPPGGVAGGDLSGSYPNPSVATVGSVSAANVAAGASAANAATDANTASTIVARDASGNFSAGTITGNLVGNVTGNVSGTASTITGSIAQSQVTDLDDDLAVKANDDAVVHLSGNETIAGTKTFSSTIVGDISGNAATATTATSATSAGSFTGSLGGDVTGTQSATTIAAGAVTTGKIADGAVTDDKVASGISYSKLSGAPSSLPPSGTAGGDLGGSYPNPTVASVGGISATSVAAGATAANASTSANTASTIVARDASGNFSAGTITANLAGNVTGNVTGNVSGTASSITGSVTQSQVTNLTSDLAAKANDNAVVHLTGNETIAGTKTFSSTIVGNISGNAATATTATSAGSFTGSLGGDVNGTQSATTVGKLQGRSVATTAPTNGQVLTWNNGSSIWEPATPAVGGLTNFTESVNTSTPNATVPVARLLATNGATNVDVALTPKGTGALMAQVPDNAIAGGNKRGIGAVDWQMSRIAASNVASGDHSTIVGGKNNTASGSYSVATGIASTASGHYSMAMGTGVTASALNSIALGYESVASNSYAISMGEATVASGEHATAIGYQTTASGSSSTAIGFSTTASGSRSTAMGNFASTNAKSGAFVYGDNSTTTVMSSSANNEFSVRAAGGYRLFSDAGMSESNGLYLNAGKVGLGVAAPQQKLDVRDGNVLLSNSGTAGELRLQGTGSGYSALKSGAQGATSITYTLPTSAPTVNGQVLSSTTGGAMSWVSSGSGLTNFTESVNTSAPNTTVPVVRLLANNGATNVDIALTPKGTGALMAQVPDNNTDGGNKRGIGATDWQRSRSVASHVAGGNYSAILGGESNTASGNYSAVLGGFGNLASGTYSTATGFQSGAGSIGSTAIGYQNSAHNDFATAIGYRATATGIGSVAIGDQPTASNTSAVAFGKATTASGNASTAMGSFTIASGQESFATGASTTASGALSTAMGYSTVASGFYSTAMGRFASTNGKDGSFVFGDASTSGTNLFSSVNNEFSVRAAGGFRFFSDASVSEANGMFLKNGSMGVGIASPNAKLDLRNGNLLVSNSGTPGEVRMQGTGTGYSALKSGAQGTTNITYTLPTAAPTADGQVLASTTGGAMSWTSQTSPVPTGYMILGTSATAPAGYTYTGATMQCAGLSGGASEVSWATKSSVGFTPRAGCAAVTANGRIYLLGGSSTNHLQEYDPSTDSWTTKSSTGYTVRSRFTAAVADNKIYALGGQVGSAYVNTNEMYDPATDSWTTKSSTGFTGRRNPGAAVVDGKIYVLGGANGTGTLNTNEMYNPSTDSWTTKSSTGFTSRDRLATAATTSKIYVLGGTSTNPVQEYDPSNDSWSTKSSTGFTNRAYLAAVTVNGRIYALGGDNGPTVYNLIEEYDPLSDSWVTKPATGFTARTQLGAAVVGNRIYACGGMNALGTVLSTNEEATITQTLYVHIKQ